MKIWYANRPLTFDNISLVWLPGDLVKRDDGKLVIHAEGGVLEVHGDGSYGYAASDAGWMAGAAKGEANLLDYPAFSDRPDGGAHPTFKVPYREDSGN